MSKLEIFCEITPAGKVILSTFVVLVIAGLVMGLKKVGEDRVIAVAAYNKLADGHDVPPIKSCPYTIDRDTMKSRLVDFMDINRAIRWNEFAIANHLGCMTASDAARLTDRDVDNMIFQVRAGVLPCR